MLRAYRVPRTEPASELGFVYPPAGVVGRVNAKKAFTNPRTFWCKRSSELSLVWLTMVATIQVS